MGALAVAAFLAISALPGTPARADGLASDETARAVAAALETTSVRVKAKLESARILESMGRREDALAALQSVESIEREGKVLVERLLASRASGGAPASGFGGGAVRAPAAPPTTIRRVSVPASTSVDAALRGARWLGSRQHADGGLRRAAEGDDATSGDAKAPLDVANKALAAVALFEVLDDSRPNLLLARSARQAVEALVLGQQAETGRFGELEEHALATWALATGFSRTGEPTWREPLKRAVAFALSNRQPTGIWNLGPLGSADDSAVVTAFMVVALHEVAAMPALSAELGVPTAIERAAQGALAVPAGSLASPLGRIARGAVAAPAETDDAGPPEALEVSEGRVYATALLLGSALARAATGGERWNEESLDAAVDAQAKASGLAGSWAGADARSKSRGRVWATAAMILADRTRFARWTEPRGT